MDLSEFVEAVMPTVGEVCAVGGCGDWQDHACVDEIRRCVAHCQCRPDDPDEPLPPLTAAAVRALFVIVDAAQRGARVARLLDSGDVVEGTARHIVAGVDDFGFLRSDEDVRNGYLRVTTTGGFDVAWKVVDLIEPTMDGRFADRS